MRSLWRGVLRKNVRFFYCSPRCSKIAYKRRKAEEMQQQRLDEMVKTIPEAREYITVTEAHALFGISRNTVYRLIEKGEWLSLIQGRIRPGSRRMI